MNPTYAPLHVHSHYSLLDGLPSPQRIVQRAKEIGAPAIARDLRVVLALVLLDCLATRSVN